jgi:hypothetical protein
MVIILKKNKEALKMNLNNFETEFNKDNYTKDNVRELLNYTFQLQANNEELLNMLVRIAYCKWSKEELEDLLRQYGYGND